MPDGGAPPVPATATSLLELRGVRVEYPLRRPLLSREAPLVLRAVDGVDLSVAQGEACALVGESGCGKSSLARAIVGLVTPTGGEIRLAGERIDRPRPRWLPRRIQIVFQDPYSSLNPRMTVAQTLGEMLRVHRVVPRAAVDARVDALLELVGLGRSVRHAYPRQLSGGQRQRVGIARAISLEPQVLVADEPVSALDVSVQATVLALLAELRERLGLTLLLIAHDLAVVRQVCDRVAVMYLGRVVETGPTETLFGEPRHPYTQALLRAVPSLRPGRRGASVAAPGEPPGPFDLPAGCRFHPRCPLARERCQLDDPPLEGQRETVATGPLTGDGTHMAACHFAWRGPTDGDGPAIIREVVG